MTFADQWANRHDGECELGLGKHLVIESYDGKESTIICHCYRRWLEGRLGESLDLLRSPYSLLADTLRLLPPNGAGE